MKNGKTITHSYSAQTTVDGNGFIVAAGAVNHPDDYAAKACPSWSRPK